MPLIDKVVKNTFYNIISQVVGYLFPIFLIPIIISKIGQTEFGIYAIAYGFIGAFTLFDLGVSTSFVKFISEYYYKNDYDGLNSTINIGALFYLCFTTLFWLLGLLFSELILHYINIPPEALEKGRFALHISFAIFFVATNSNIFVSVLISLQKMYINSFLTIIIGIINFISIVVVLLMGFGIYGLLFCQLFTVIIGTTLNIILAKKYLPQMSFGIKYLKLSFLKKMTSFGAQMQVSKLAGFFSEKYDEFLLGVFSLLDNVTFFNISGRIVRFAKLIPMQFIIQVAPVAAELNSRSDLDKLKTLFRDTTKYLTFVTIPISVFIFIFSNEIIFTWMGSGYDVSSYILRILIIGMIVNMIISSPGNSILPNIGIPKYQMYEGLLHFFFNVTISYFLIRNYGLVGAAYGNMIATVVSSVYVFIMSVRYFQNKYLDVMLNEYILPFTLSIFSGLTLYYALKASNLLGFHITNRINGIAFFVIAVAVYSFIYLYIILDTKYLNNRNNIALAKIVLKFFPFVRFRKRETPVLKKYDGELVSIVILTFNKVKALNLCLSSLIPSVEYINKEIIIWDNNSDDGTDVYLKEIESSYSFIRVIRNNDNIGNNAKSKLVDIASGDFIVGVDDDVIEFPDSWVENMVSAYKSVPYMGYLVADVVQDEKTNGAKFPEDSYSNKDYFDGLITIQAGPVGGWCFMVSREVYNETGKLLTIPDRKFIFEDGDFQLRVSYSGFQSGILKGVKVYHATGDYYNEILGNPLKTKYTDAIKPLPVIYKMKRKAKNFFNVFKKYRKLKRFLISEELI
jgi:O-antigen/teichoic acid export membrane protein